MGDWSERSAKRIVKQKEDFEKAWECVKELLRQENAVDDVIKRQRSHFENNGGVGNAVFILNELGYFVYSQGTRVIITDKEIKPM